MATISADLDLNISKLLSSLNNAQSAAIKAAGQINTAFKGIEPVIDVAVDLIAEQAQAEAKTLKNNLDIPPVEIPIKADFTKIAEQARTAGKAVSDAFVTPSGSLDTSKLASGFSQLQTQAKNAVAEQRNALAALTATGQKGTAEFKQVEAQLQEAVTEANRLDNALADVDKEISSVGDKKIDIGGQLSEGLKGGLLGGIIGGGIAGAVTTGLAAVGEGFKATIELGQEFEQSLAGLSAITGVQGDGLTDLGNRARDLAKEFGGTATSQLESFQGVLSKFGAQLADTPDQLGEVSKNINILAKAGGLDAKGAMDALTASMLQFGVNVNDANEVASESGRFINVLAKSAQVGAAEIPQVAEAILQAGVAAKGANLSFEETNAGIQILAAGGKVGSEAGVALRNVLGLLIKQSGEGEQTFAKFGTSTAELGKILTTQGLGAALEKVSGGLQTLGSDAERAAALSQLFGSENAAAAGILLDGAGTLKGWTAQMTGTQSAVEQAATNMNTFGERIERLKSNFQDFGLTIYQAVVPIANQIFSTLSSVFSQVGAILAPVISGIADNFSRMFEVVKPIYAILGGAIIGTVIGLFTSLSLTIKFLTDVVAGLYEGIANALVPLFAKIGELFGQTGSKALTLSDVMSGLGTVVSFVGDVLGVVGKVLVLIIVKPIETMINAVIQAIDWFKKFSDFMNGIEKSVGGFIRGMLGIKDSTDAASGSVKEHTEITVDDAKAMQESIVKQLEDNKAKEAASIGVQTLAKRFQELAAKTNRTKAETDELRGIQDKLEKQYPNLVDQTKNFSDNLNGVAEIGKLTTESLKGLNAQNAELQKQMASTVKLVAGATRDEALKALRESTDSALFENDTLSKFKEKLAAESARFDKSVWLAKTQKDIEDAEIVLRRFFNVNAPELTSKGLTKEFLNFQKLMEGAINASKDAGRAFFGDAANAGKEGAAKTAESATDEFKKLQGELNKFKKDFGGLTKDQQKEQGSIIGDSIKNALTISQTQRKALDDQLQAIISPKKSDDKKDKSEIELLKEKLALKRDEIQDTRKDIDLKNELALAEDGVQKADAERIKQNKAASRLKAAQDELTAAKELFKAEQTGDTFTIPVSIKGDGKERQAAVELLEDINREVKAAKFEAIKVQAEVDKDSVLRSIATLGESIKADEKTLKENLNVETALKFPDKEVFKTKIQQGLLSLARSEETIKAKIAVTADSDIKEKLTKELESVAKIREEQEKKYTEILSKVSIQRREADIAAIADDAQRQLETKIFNLEKQRDKELENEALTAAGRLVIAERYQKEIDKLRNGQAAFSLEQAALSLQERLQKAFTGTVSDEEKKRTEAKNAELNKQSEDLQAQLKKGEIEYADYLTKLSELDQQRAGLSASITDNILGAVNSTASETLRAIADAQKTSALEAFAAAKTSEDARIALMQETADLELEIDKARADGKVDIEQDLQARLDRLRGNSGKTTTELAEKAAKLQDDISKAHTEGRADDEKKLTAELSDVQKEQGANTEKSGEKIVSAYTDIASGAALALGAAAIEGQNFGKAAQQTAYDTLQGLVPIFVAQIFGTTFAELGPILGPIATAAATGLLYGLVSLAKPSGAEGGAPEGITGTYNKPRGNTDTIPLWVAPREAIINARQSDTWRDTLVAINSGGDVLQSVLNNTGAAEIAALMHEHFTPAEIAKMTELQPVPVMQRPVISVQRGVSREVQNIVVMQDMTAEIKSVAKAVKVMHKDLSVQSRKPVEVIGGKLKTDGNNITATFERLRKRNVTRG